MNKMEIFDKVVEICKDAFDDNKFKFEESTSASDIEKWDSLTHLSVIGDLEDEFKINFTLDEMENSKNIGKLVDIVMRHISEKQ